MPPKVEASKPCPHTHVRLVSRDEDGEYVECLACGHVFESSEFEDMEIEARVAAEQDVEAQE